MADTIYRTTWVDDIPVSPEDNTIYIVGKYPEHYANAVLNCPQCRQAINLNVMEDSTANKWYLTANANGTVSLNPSVIHDSDDCGAHFWIVNGEIRMV